MTVEIFVFCGRCFSNQFDIVSTSGTHLTCYTVGRELLLAILSLLFCSKTGRNIRIAKQDYMFILSDFKK